VLGLPSLISNLAAASFKDLLRVTSGLFQRENLYPLTISQTTVTVTDTLECYNAYVNGVNGGNIYVASGGLIRLRYQGTAQIPITVPFGATVEYYDDFSSFANLPPGDHNITIGGNVTFSGDSLDQPAIVEYNYDTTSGAGTTYLGAFTLLPTAVINVRVFGATQYPVGDDSQILTDTIAFDAIGSCVYGGQLNLALQSGASYTPAAGDIYAVFESDPSTCQRCTGSFASVVFTSFPSSVAPGVLYDLQGPQASIPADAALSTLSSYVQIEACSSTDSSCAVNTRATKYIDGCNVVPTTSTTKSATSGSGGASTGTSGHTTSSPAGTTSTAGTITRPILLFPLALLLLMVI